MQSASDRLRYLYGLGGLGDTVYTPVAHHEGASAPNYGDTVWNPPVAHHEGTAPAQYEEPIYGDAPPLEPWYKQPKWWAVGGIAAIGLILIARTR